jgi:platelet-activating factor acetylhydrolase
MLPLSSLFNPIPFLPTYNGPYEVGTIDVEIPVSDLESSSPSPDSSITTIRHRIFYPCETPRRKANPVYWISEPQRAVIEAYAGILGLNPALAKWVA